MYIENFTIQNYKSFADSGVVKLGRGFNVIVGANNAGKTAMLEALSLRFTDQPHRSMITAPHSKYPVEPRSSIRITFHLNPGEVTDLLLDKTETFAIPMGSRTESAVEVLNLLLGENVFNGTCVGSATLHGALDSLANYTGSMGLFYKWDPKQRQFCGDSTVTQLSYNQPLADALQERIYMFRAARVNARGYAVSSIKHLEPNAANLAQVLHELQSRRMQFERLNSYISRIFPDIGWISAPIEPNSSNTYISIHPALGKDANREDLAVPLSESGTGVGQVLAMLYVVLTSEQSQVIIIDEPQSFLHPGAIRKLFEIIREFPQHQYIVTTHSPEVIAAANPTTLTLLRKVGAETLVQQLDVQEAQHMRAVLSEVGARFSDVFGADQILWVEGPTEEYCFPLIVEHLLKRPLMGAKIVGLLNTGDIERKDLDGANRAIGIYKKLSQGGSLIPPAVGFILDRELRPGAAQQEIKRRIENAGIRAAFIPRRMYENYLLDPRAIAAVTLGIERFYEDAIEESAALEQVENWLSQVPSNPDYFAKDTAIPVEDWLPIVDGAKVLGDLFSQLSECRIEYVKTEYGPVLTQWIVENEPESLREIADTLGEMLSSSETDR